MKAACAKQAVHCVARGSLYSDVGERRRTQFYPLQGTNRLFAQSSC